MPTHITLRGARQHNLANLELSLPRDRLVVITGVSGSGKSSLAFDTLHAEGQRAYVESLSVYARSFLAKLGKPDIDSIEGLSPTIAIQQRTLGHNPRSTVATVTELHDHLRLLFARAGTVHCWQCGRPMERVSASELAARLVAERPGASVNIVAPRQGSATESNFERLRRQGLRRVRLLPSEQAGASALELIAASPVVDLAETTPAESDAVLELIVDRVRLEDDRRARLADSLELAFRVGQGCAVVEVLSAPPVAGANAESPQGGEPEPRARGVRLVQRIEFSERAACTHCGLFAPELSPRHFSFNSPDGACPECNGLGEKLSFDEQLVLPDRSRSLMDGAIVAISQGEDSYTLRLVENLVRHDGGDPRVPVAALPPAILQRVLYGTREAIDWDLHDKQRKRHYRFNRPWEGVIPWLHRRWLETQSEMMRVELERYMRPSPCGTCHGARLRPESLAVRVGERNLAEITAATVRDAARFFASLQLPARDEAVVDRVLKEIRARLAFLTDVGLDYLSLGRTASTLSGGEAQRIRLATQLGSALTGVVYVLDEPSIGLHHADNARLLAALKGMRDRGNTVLVVEHDEETMRAADWLVELGPGAGREGGRVVYAGELPGLLACPESLTGAYLSGRRQVAPAIETRSLSGTDLARGVFDVESREDACPSLASSDREARLQPTGWLHLEGATRNNLRSLDVDLPLGLLCVITGVSGSGKSSLALDVLVPALQAKLRNEPLPSDLRGLWIGAGLRKGAQSSAGGLLDRVVLVDADPIGRSPRSNPATYIGLFDTIRKLFAQLPEARARGYGAQRFSFNVKGGRCETCQGDGVVRHEMHFLPDVEVVCEVCAGRRYNRETQEILYRGRSIADVLAMSVAEASVFFRAVPSCRQKLELLDAVGLGYLALGQSATTLSGGEAQRIKLARELVKRESGRALYVLDEPTTGLHFEDIRRLLELLRRLVARGHSVLLIEHQPDLVRAADWLVDLGPGGGDQGGQIVGEGTPEAIARLDTPTGRALRASS